MKILLKIVKWTLITVLSFILVLAVLNIVPFSLSKAKNENHFRKNLRLSYGHSSWWG